MDPTVQFDDMHDSPSPVGNKYFEPNNELDLTPTSGSGGKRPADDGSDIGSYGNIIAPEDKDDAPRIKRPKNQGDKPKPTTAESEPEPEDDPVFDIMYKMVVAKKNITCKWKSSLTFNDFWKNSVELSRLKETGRWRLELGWKFMSATMAETYDALDDEEDYEWMISLMCKNFKQRKQNSRTNAREILLEVLNKLHMHPGKQCQQHPGLPCCVLAGNDQVGQHVLYSHDDMKKWAQCLKMGLLTFDEPPVSISEVAEQQKNMLPPLG
ncbi:hypothetical protein BS47DRAFT_1366633 [Hydnum rufescens UP504]|uniref:Uncharacterized protein n=1 Tax=Hydnum rufescens UP504 TaxID=1448309 RepID=A0A9P6ALB3_9AGAM|nr:hypothetical protein BS47DRAFT_1366633 [Hydnum rufescens UP504]